MEKIILKRQLESLLKKTLKSVQPTAITISGQIWMFTHLLGYHNSIYCLHYGYVHCSHNKDRGHLRIFRKQTNFCSVRKH